MLDIRLGTPVLKRDPKKFAELCRRLLVGLVMANVETMQWARRMGKPFPPLLKSGVRYRAEPPGEESFVDAWILLRRGYGDCAHLCAYRIAELMCLGERASIRIKWNVPDDPRSRRPRLFHVQVRRADGRIEDTSRLLGM